MLCHNFISHDYDCRKFLRIRPIADVESSCSHRDDWLTISGALAFVIFPLPSAVIGMSLKNYSILIDESPCVEEHT